MTPSPRRAASRAGGRAGRPPPPRTRAGLEALYRAGQRRERVHPDPLWFLYRYPDVRDREVAGLVASALAYGRVPHIMTSVGAALAPLGPRPAGTLRATGALRSLAGAYSGFRHRWTRGETLLALLRAAARLLEAHGTLEDAFAAGLGGGAPGRRVERALDGFSRAFLAAAPELEGTGLLPSPRAGSACKRWNLYLRWMVRSDAVDPGGWRCIEPRDLLVPLDVHLFRTARAMNLTGRRQPDWRAVLEVTGGFRRLRPDDPVRYDFVLTRPGIRGAARS